MFRGNRKLLEDVLEGLFHIAKADGAHPRGGSILAEVAKRFGFTETDSPASRRATSASPSAIPYDVLGRRARLVPTRS